MGPLGLRRIEPRHMFDKEEVCGVGGIAENQDAPGILTFDQGLPQGLHIGAECDLSVDSQQVPVPPGQLCGKLSGGPACIPREHPEVALWFVVCEELLQQFRVGPSTERVPWFRRP